MSGFLEKLPRHLLANDTTARLMHSSLVRSVSGSFVLQIFALGMRFLTSIVMARLLTTGDYGTLTYVTSWILTLAVPAALGFDYLLVREVAAYRATEQWSLMRGLIRVSTIIGLGLSATAATLLFVVTSLQMVDLRAAYVLPPVTLRTLVDHTGLHTFGIGLLLLPPLVLLSIQNSTMRGFRAIIRSQLPRTALYPSLFLVLFVVIFFLNGQHLTPPQIMALRVIAAGCAVVYSLILLRKTLPNTIAHSPSDFAEIKTWIIKALPMLGTSMFVTLYARIDVLMLGALRSVEEVALYSVVLVLSSLIVMVLSSTNLSVGPLFSEYYAAGQMDKLQRLVIKSARGILLSSLPIMVALLVGGDWLLSLYGSAYRPAYPILVILITGQFVNMATGSVGILLSMTEHERYLLISRAIGLIIYIGMNLLLIPIWGGIGAAIATAVSMSLLNLLQIWFAWRKLGIVSVAFGRLK